MNDVPNLATVQFGEVTVLLWMVHFKLATIHFGEVTVLLRMVYPCFNFLSSCIYIIQLMKVYQCLTSSVLILLHRPQILHTAALP